MERRFDEIERETNKVFKLDDFDVGSLLLHHFQAIGQFDSVLGDSFSDEKEIVSGKKFNKSQRRTMNVDGVVGKSLELDEDMPFKIFALGVEVAKTDRKLRCVTMTLIVGSDGNVFDVEIEELVLINCVLDFIENSVESVFRVDFDDLALAESPRFVNLCHEVFFVDVITAGVAVFLQSCRVTSGRSASFVLRVMPCLPTLLLSQMPFCISMMIGCFALASSSSSSSTILRKSVPDQTKLYSDIVSD